MYRSFDVFFHDASRNESIKLWDISGDVNAIEAMREAKALFDQLGLQVIVPNCLEIVPSECTSINLNARNCFLSKCKGFRRGRVNRALEEDFE